MLSSFAFRSAARFSAKARFHASALQEAKLNVQGLADLVDLKGQNVLVRVDLNVPLDKKVRVLLLLLSSGLSVLFDADNANDNDNANSRSVSN